PLPRFCPCPSLPHRDTAAPTLYPLSLHDALPICPLGRAWLGRADVHPTVHLHRIGTEYFRAALPSHRHRQVRFTGRGGTEDDDQDRKSTRLNSSHVKISYAVFCLKKKRSNTTSCV